MLPAWDRITGQMAARGLIAAERHPRRTGQGRLVEVALKGVALAMLGNLGILAEATVNGEDRPKCARRLGLDLAREGDRFRARKEIGTILEPWLYAHRAADFARSFEHGVTWSEFRCFAQAVAEDPGLSTENPMFSLPGQPNIGSYLAPRSPLAIGALRREPPRRAPFLGEHTDGIPSEVVGLGGAEIARLHDAGALVRPEGVRGETRWG